jgi:hypothetical protein
VRGSAIFPGLHFGGTFGVVIVSPVLQGWTIAPVRDCLALGTLTTSVKLIGDQKTRLFFNRPTTDDVN